MGVSGIYSFGQVALFAVGGTRNLGQHERCFARRSPYKEWMRKHSLQHGNSSKNSLIRDSVTASSRRTGFPYFKIDQWQYF